MRELLFASLLCACASSTTLAAPDAAPDLPPPPTDVAALDAADVTTLDAADVTALDARDVVDVADARDARDVTDVVDVADARDVPPPDVECPLGTANCRGACIDLQTSGAHCGACGNACPPGGRCCRGRCTTMGCSPLYGDCDGDCATGCETSLATDVRNCGACGRVCTAPAGTTARCQGGVCVTTTNCGATDCDRNAANGAETDTRSSVCHCGACGRSCLAGNGVADARCADCACVLQCHPNYADCDRDPANGCEAYTPTDTRHCGACGRACLAFERCVDGACMPGAVEMLCGEGYVDVARDVRHCGGCNNRCPADQPACFLGRCVPSCPAPYNAGCSNTPCVDLRSDPRHCGACDAGCMIRFDLVCRDGRCTSGPLGCPMGQTVCGRTCVDTQNDPLNCGACGRTCPLRSTCRFGACSPPCPTP